MIKCKIFSVLFLLLMSILLFSDEKDKEENLKKLEKSLEEIRQINCAVFRSKTVEDRRNKAKEYEGKVENIAKSIGLQDNIIIKYIMDYQHFLIVGKEKSFEELHKRFENKYYSMPEELFLYFEIFEVGLTKMSDLEKRKTERPWMKMGKLLHILSSGVNDLMSRRIGRPHRPKKIYIPKIGYINCPTQNFSFIAEKLEEMKIYDIACESYRESVYINFFLVLDIK